MRFLQGLALTNEIKKICKTKTAIKLAVAYWGQDALKLTKLSFNRRDVKLLCCLKGGASDPKIIRKFGARARHKDALHAKVIWTHKSAIVSSANISSNGLPEEEKNSTGLIEAGILVTEPKHLSAIRKWFDREYQSGEKIRPADLREAEEARASRLWGKPKVRRGLIEALKQGGAQEFKHQRIALILWDEPTSQNEERAISRMLKDNPEKVERITKLGRGDFRNLDRYTGWDDIPANTFLIDCHYKGGRIGSIRLNKTFDANKKWPILLKDGEKEWVNFALRKGFVGFDYILGERDKKVIRKAGRLLWERRGKDRGKPRVLRLIDVAPTLLRHA